MRHRHGSERSRKDEGKGPAWHLEKMWKLGWELPCRAPSRVPSTVRFSGPMFPERPPTPLTAQLSSPASHAPHFLPREGRCWGLLSKVWECSLRLTQDDAGEREERERKEPSPKAYNPNPALSSSGSGNLEGETRVPKTPHHPDFPV